MGQTNLHIFDWSVEHKNLPLTAYMLSHSHERDAFIMLARHNYTPLKNFVTSNLERMSSDISKEDVFVDILGAALQIEPRWKIEEVINDCFSTSSVNLSIIIELKKRLLLEEMELQPAISISSNEQTAARYSPAIFQMNNASSLINNQTPAPELPEKDGFSIFDFSR